MGGRLVAGQPGRGGVRLFVFGLGYTALALALGRGSAFAQVGGTVRTAEKAARLSALGIDTISSEGSGVDDRIRAALAEADAVLATVPPDERGDPVLDRFSAAIATAPHVAWIGYLSTIGVYGDHGGGWVDETTPPAPGSERARRRLVAEQAWQELGRRSAKPVHVFRLSGIYGPGRNALVNLADGTARRIVKPGQVFNRAHVDDIATVLAASMARPRPQAIYNVADDEPAPPQDVVAFAARLAGVEPPPEVRFEDAFLSPMAASFYADNKRVRNRLIREELGTGLRYPTYRDGLRALFAAGEGRPGS